MPRPEELPESLTRLVRRQALELSPERFEFDTNRLLKVLETTLDEVPRTQGDVTSPAAAAAAITPDGAPPGRGAARPRGRAGPARPGPGCWPGPASPWRWSWWPPLSLPTCGRRRQAAASRSTRPR